MERRAYALSLAYCGQPFAGWQRQPARPTVQAVVETALAKAGLDVAISAAARTDAGVHARPQRLTFRVREELPCPALLATLSAELPRSVRPLALREVGASFHARASPHLREYRYRVRFPVVGQPRPPRYTWSLPDPSSLLRLPDHFDARSARDFLASLTGRRDRSPHTTRPEQRPKLTTLTLAELDERCGGRLLFRFQGDGFTRHLVRNWVWAAVARGCGATAAETAYETPSGWRGPTAPGHGLILWDLIYDGEPGLFSTVPSR